MTTATTHFGIIKPTVGGSTSVWGTITNADWDLVDTFLYNATYGIGAWCGVAGGSANVLTFTPSPAITAYADGIVIRGKSGAAANTTSATLNLNGLGALTIYRTDETTVLVAGDIPASSDLSFMIKTTGGNKAILLTTPPNSAGAFTSLVVTGPTTLTNTGSPLTVNSSNSTQYKIRLQDNAVSRGYLGADVTYCVTLNSSSATAYWGAADLNGAFIPLSTYDIGTAANHVGKIYTNSINLNGVDITGTTGSGNVVLANGASMGIFTLTAPAAGDRSTRGVSSAWVGGELILVQRVSTETGSVNTGSTVIPNDDTIPQNSEGDQYMSLSVTPKSATNILVIDVVCTLATSAASNVGLTAALFQDSTANALSASKVGTSGQNIATTVCFRHIMTSGTAVATTFKVRGGGGNVGTTTFNGESGSQRYGGVMASSIMISEYTQ